MLQRAQVFPDHLDVGADVGVQATNKEGVHLQPRHDIIESPHNLLSRTDVVGLQGVTRRKRKGHSW